MIEMVNKILFFQYKRIWFAHTLPRRSPFTFISLRQYRGQAPEHYHEKKFMTLISDLTQSEGELLSLIAKNTKYKIKRAARENCCADVVSLDEFAPFFNEFAPSKNLHPLTKKNIETLKPYSIATAVKAVNTPILAMHLYLIDKSISRVRLLYSATVNRKETDLDLNFVGRANRFLHWDDMLRFKSMNIKNYDWGGIAGTDDPATSGIDDFKKAFGGYEVHENHYEDKRLYLIKKILKR